MSDEPVEDSDASSDADSASPAGSGDPDAPEDAPDSADSDEPTSSESQSGADATDSASPASSEDPETDGRHEEGDQGDTDGETDAETDADTTTPDDADAPDSDATDADTDGTPDSAGPGSARARMGSQPPDPSDDEGRVSSHDPDDVSRTPGDVDASTDDGPDAGADDFPDAPGTPDDRPDVDRDAADSAAPYDSGDADGPAGARGSAPRTSAHARGGAKASTSGDAGATAAGAAAEDDGGSSGGILSGGIGGSAPPDDEEMPLTEHIEEMLTRLGIVVVVAAFATLAAFPIANDLIIQMWYDVHYGTVEACRAAPQSDDCVAPHVYGPLELVLTRIRVAGLAGLLVALPLAVYQTYRFMRPGLYPHERRYFLAAVPFSLVLAIVGMVFAYFVMLPLLFAYFISYTQGTADLAFQLAETMNIILLMMGMLAIIFQIPLLIMLAIMMGITTRRWLERRRLYFWGLFVGVAFIFGPDPTGMAPFLLTATMVVLFEGTLLLLRWTGR